MKSALLMSWTVTTVMLTSSGGCDDTKIPPPPSPLGKVVQREDSPDRNRTTLHVKTGNKTTTHRHEKTVKCRVGDTYPDCLNK